MANIGGVASLGDEPETTLSPRIPPSPPGTPRISLFEGSASVAWEPSARTAHHKVLCADLERHQVGYVDVEPGKAQVLIENVSGKYRIDIVAFNDAGASAPKQAFFDCSQGAVAHEELENAFSEWQQYQQFAPPKRGPVGARPPEADAPAQPRYGESPDRDQERKDALSLSPERRGRRAPSPQRDSPKKYGLEVGRALRSPDSDYNVRDAGDTGGHRMPSPEFTSTRSLTKQRTKPSSKQTPREESALGPAFNDTSGTPRLESRYQRQGQRGPFAQRSETSVMRADRDSYSPVRGMQSPERREDRDLRAERLTQSLTASAQAAERAKSPARRQPRFEKWLELESPEIPNVVPRVLGSRPPANGDEGGKLLQLRTEVHEDSCTLRWGWRGKAPGIGAYTVFGARLGERWEVSGRLQYGESSCTARHLPRGQTYAFVLYATPVGTFDEGWVSRVMTVTVQPGKPAPPRNVKLSLDNDVVVASWDPPKGDTSGEAITGYKVRAEDDAEGKEGVLLCEVPAACKSLSWPFRRYQGGAAITVSTVSVHRVESDRISSALQLPDAAKTAPVHPPTIEPAPDGSSTILIHWVATDILYRYAILIKVRGARRVRRFPVTATPATCVLEPGQEVVAALEADSQSTGPRVSAWSAPITVKPREPFPPGRPCVRQTAHDLQLSWATPLDCKEPVSYIVIVEAQDGRKAEVNAGKQPYWSVPLDDLMDHFHKTRLRFAVVAVGSAGRSPISPWSPKQLFQPSDDWLVKYKKQGGAGDEQSVSARPSATPKRDVTPPRTPQKGALTGRPRWRIA